MTVRTTDVVPQSCFILKYPGTNISPVFLHCHITATYINAMLVSLQTAGYQACYLYNMLTEKA